MIAEKPSLYRMERQRAYNATGEPTNEDRDAGSFDAGEDEGVWIMFIIWMKY